MRIRLASTLRRLVGVRADVGSGGEVAGEGGGGLVERGERLCRRLGERPGRGVAELAEQGSGREGRLEAEPQVR
jgi:hypothetical protein